MAEFYRDGSRAGAVVAMCSSAGAWASRVPARTSAGGSRRRPGGAKRRTASRL